MNWLVFSVLNAFFESLSNLFGKRGAQKLDILSVTWGQRFFSLFIILPLALFTHSFQPVNQSFWFALIITSFLNTIASLLFIKAIKDSPLSLTLPIVTLTPIFLLITSPLILGEFPKPLGILGIISAVIGAYVLNLSKRIKGFFEPFLSIAKEEGPRYMLIVALIWSITSNVDKIAVKNSNPILYTLASACSIGILLTIVLIYKQISLKKVFKNAYVLAPVGFATGLSIVFQMVAISMTIVPNVITVKRTSALFGIAWGKIFFKEENIRERLIGALVMIVGVVLVAISTQQ